MKHVLLAATALTALSFSAVAADLPKRSAPAMAPAPVFSWAGPYLGLSAGYISNKTKSVGVDGPNEGNADDFNLSGTGGGGLAGATAGYNFQNGAFIYGVEADFSVANTNLDKLGIFNGSDNRLQNQLTSFGTLRARLGYAIQPRTMIYATGGLAVANVQSYGFTYDTNDMDCRSGFSGLKTGWTVGGGIEHALSNSLTFKVEGLYYNLGKKTGGGYDNGGCDCRNSFKNTGVVARVGLNFKF